MNKTRALNQENNALDRQLDGEYASVMTDLVCYLRSADITNAQAERLRRDLLEMFIGAKERGEDVQSLIGGDLRAFCDEILESVPRRSLRQKAAGALSTALICLGILGILRLLLSRTALETLRVLLAGGMTVPRVTVSLGVLLSIAAQSAAACAVVELLCRTVFQQRRVSCAVPGAVMVLLLTAALICELTLRSVVVASLPLWAGAAAVLGCLAVGYILHLAEQ